MKEKRNGATREGKRKMQQVCFQMLRWSTRMCRIYLTFFATVDRISTCCVENIWSSSSLFFFYSIKKRKKTRTRLHDRILSRNTRQAMRWSWYYFVAVIPRSLERRNEMAKEPLTWSLYFATEDHVNTLKVVK